MRPVRQLDHLQLELNSSTTIPFLGQVGQCDSKIRLVIIILFYQVHYDQISPRYNDHEICQLSNASYSPTTCIWSNTVSQNKSFLPKNYDMSFSSTETQP